MMIDAVGKSNAHVQDLEAPANLTAARASTKNPRSLSISAGHDLLQPRTREEIPAADPDQELEQSTEAGPAVTPLSRDHGSTVAQEAALTADRGQDDPARHEEDPAVARVLEERVEEL